MSKILRLAAALAVAAATQGASASQVTGTGIGATNHPTIPGPLATPPATAKASPPKGAKTASTSASSGRR